MDHYPEFKTFEVASEPPPGLPGATRLIAKPTIAKGSADFVPLKDYLSVAICNFENLTNWEDSAAGSDQLKLHFRLTDHDDFEVHKLTAAALFQPHDVIKKEVYFADNREKSVTVFCRIADYLASNNIPHSAIPDSMAFLLTNDTPDFFYVDFAMNAEIHQATEALVSMNVEGELRALFVEAKTNELICLFLQALKSLEDASSTAVRLSKQDLANLHSARSILDTQYADAPTIIQLARKVGVNKQKLTRGFKYIFGLTVYDYLLSVRMARARTLLLETELSITQIALEVGYEYAGNFTTAFKRYFGVPPNVMRKGK
jgi:AraC-like DNA-binding protein